MKSKQFRGTGIIFIAILYILFILKILIMADNNRNRGYYASDENWDQNRNRREDDYYQNRENQGGYGNVGYNNQNRGMQGNYGENMQNRNYGNYGGAYSSDYGSDYGNRERNYRNQGSWDNQSGDYGNHSGRNSGWNRGQWSGAGNYTDYDRNREDWVRNNVNTGQNYNQGYDNYGDQRQRNMKNRYGGDTNNYGNANQGGFDRNWWDRTRDEVSSWFGDDDADRRRHMDRQNTGMHRGKGPKGYERSADRIREDVCERLSYDDRIDASDIEVKVNGNEVVLDGTVETRQDRHRAEDLIESVSGVSQIQNNLRVRQR